MKTHARVVVIGGGVVGCSVLYHLTKLGWRDAVLIERDELTSGSTWHAAGGMHTFNGDINVAKLQKYTIDLYKEIEAISGQACGLHVIGGLMLGGTPERMDFLKIMHAKARHLGIDTALVSADEAARMFPMMDKKYFLGAIFNPYDGHLDPSGVTHAYAKAARMQGAEIYRANRVVECKPQPDGTWDVVTQSGTIRAEHVVNAGGLWAREVGRMVGLELPVLAMQHHYLVTEAIPEVVNAPKEVLHIVDFEGEIYMRQEGKGMLMGTYEQRCAPWSERTTPWDFGRDLLPPDLERIAPSLETGFKHFPAIGRAGIKRIVNGPFAFAPDGNPLVGPVRGLRNYWVACGVMAGFSQGGGVGLALASWMIDGDPGADIWGMDVSRFGDWATMAHTNAKVRENYSRRWRIRFPNEELPAGRNLRMTPIYDRQKQAGAVFGTSYGTEYALWFAPKGTKAEEDVTFRRSNAFGPVAEECRAVRAGVGLLETSIYGRYEVTGPDAEPFLSRLLPARMPREGRMVLTPMLSPQGKLIGDLTVAKLAGDRFFIVGSGIAEDYHMRWFEAHLPKSGVGVRPLRRDVLGLSIAGPRSRELLQRVTHADVSAKAFPFFSIRRMDLGAIPALVGRVTYTGDLGYEIWVGADYQLALYDLLSEAGRDLGLRPFGIRALDSMRLEKSFGSWAREYRPIYTPFEAGVDHLIDFAKNDFIGRDAALSDRDAGAKLKLVAMTVDEDGADVLGDEPIWLDGKVVGWVTSGGYAHHSRKSVALGYLRREVADPANRFKVEIIGDMRPALIAPRPLFDPDATRMRG